MSMTGGQCGVVSGTAGIICFLNCISLYQKLYLVLVAQVTLVYVRTVLIQGLIVVVLQIFYFLNKVHN